MSHINTKSLITAALLSFPLASLSEIQFYVLKKGSTLSNLLYDELKFNYIYTRPSILDQVLELNKLTEEDARKLRPGTVILVPMPSQSVPIVKEVPELEKPVPVDETPPDSHERLSFASEVRLGIEMFSFSGSSENDDSDFQVASVMTSLFYQIKSQSTNFFGAQFDGGLTKFQGSQSYVADRESLYLLGGRSFGNSSASLMAGFKRDFYLYSTDGIKEKLIKGFTPSLGFRIEHKAKSFKLGGQLMNYLSASIGKSQKTANNLSLSIDAGYWPVQWNEKGLILKVQKDEKNLKTYSQDLSSVSLSLGALF